MRPTPVASPFLLVSSTHIISCLQAKAEEQAAHIEQAEHEASEMALAELLRAGQTEQLAVRLHAMLQAYPNVRERWLSGISFQLLLDERPLGVAWTCCTVSVRVVGGYL